MVSKRIDSGETTGTGRFQSQGENRFMFEYPIFKGWEPYATKKLDDYNYAILLSCPDGLEWEVATQVRVRIAPELGLNNLRNKSKSNLPSARNPNGIFYDQIKINDEFQLLGFVLYDYGVAIGVISVSEELGFQIQNFFKKIIQTFNIEK